MELETNKSLVSSDECFVWKIMHIYHCHDIFHACVIFVSEKKSYILIALSISTYCLLRICVKTCYVIIIYHTNDTYHIQYWCHRKILKIDHIDLCFKDKMSLQNRIFKMLIDTIRPWVNLNFADLFLFLWWF